MINLFLANLSYKLWQFFGKRCSHPNHKYITMFNDKSVEVVHAFFHAGKNWYTTKNLIDLPVVRLGALANEIKKLQLARLIDYLSGKLTLKEALEDPGDLTPRLMACIYWHEDQSPYELDIEATAPLLNHPISTGISLSQLISEWKKLSE